MSTTFRKSRTQNYSFAIFDFFPKLTYTGVRRIKKIYKRHKRGNSEYFRKFRLFSRARKCLKKFTILSNYY